MLVLPPQLTHQQASACLRMLVQALPAETGAAVVVDATALQQFDSSALAVLLEFRRICLRLGKRLQVRGLTARLRDLARLYGVEELLQPAG